MEQHYRRFVEQLKLRNVSPTTLKSYTETVQRYSRFCRDRRIRPESLESARSYLVYLKVDLDRAPSTVNVVYSALKRYFIDGQVAEWTIEAIPRCRRPRRLPVVLSKDQVLELFEVTRRWRDRVSFMIAYSAGLRRIEVRHLLVEDIDSKKMRIFVREGKGQKQRYVMLSQRLLEYLRQYWRLERPKHFLFPSERRPGRPICGDTLSKAFRQSRDQASLPKRSTFHSLRHSFATHLLEDRVPLPHIQALLGHSSLQSTLIYLKVANVSKKVRSPLDQIGVVHPALVDGD